MNATIEHYRKNIEAQVTALEELEQYLKSNPALAKLAAEGWMEIDYKHDYVHDGVIGPKRSSYAPVYIHRLSPHVKVEITFPLEEKDRLRETLIEAGYTRKVLDTGVCTYKEIFKLPLDDYEYAAPNIMIVFYVRAKPGDEFGGCKIVKQDRTLVRLSLACERSDAGQ